ncbi:uncharacterized protein LOC101856027 [Aplysia californica]|uniref:Uncharacterized protein LOC101856027 n=1 Tax=Aplysia californica TaxID=6500 RepID=A0ABM1A104_APLCA|nr:uncharacterized protein LOC101856027 [Aplysia californica]
MALVNILILYVVCLASIASPHLQKREIFDFGPNSFPSQPAEESNDPFAGDQKGGSTASVNDPANENSGKGQTFNFGSTTANDNGASNDSNNNSGTNNGDPTGESFNFGGSFDWDQATEVETEDPFAGQNLDFWKNPQKKGDSSEPNSPIPDPGDTGNTEGEEAPTNVKETNPSEHSGPSFGGSDEGTAVGASKSGENKSFDFSNNNGGSSPDGNVWDDGMTVPTVDIWEKANLPQLDDKESEESSEIKVVAECSVDYCKFLDPCDPGETCRMDPDCKFVQCVKISESKQTGPETKEETVSGDTSIAEQMTSEPLRPLEERTCGNGTLFKCRHGVCDNTGGGVVCMCDEKWSGDLCEKPCWLSCVHGLCAHKEEKKPDTYTVEDLYCNCEHDWVGGRCEMTKPDPEREAKILAGGLTAALVIVVAIAVALPVLLWRLRVVFIMKVVNIFKDYEDDDGKVYDAYVSMSPTPEAEKFVYSLLRPRLEDVGFKLYLQARDQPAGEAISETILDAVTQSRRTILIINPDYVEREWSRFEFLIAQHETLKLKQRIIPIILKDLCEEARKKDKTLKHIMESVKCLQYPHLKSENSSTSPQSVSREQHSQVDVLKKEKKFKKKECKFWERLELTMPKKRKSSEKKLSFLEKLKMCKKSRDKEQSASEHSTKSSKAKVLENKKKADELEAEFTNPNILGLAYKNILNAHVVDMVDLKDPLSKDKVGVEKSIEIGHTNLAADDVSVEIQL